MKIISNNKNEKWLTDLCDTKNLFVSLVFIQISVFMYALSFLTLDAEFIKKLSNLTMFVQFIGITILIALCKFRGVLNRMNVTYGIGSVILMVLLIIFLITSFLNWVDSTLISYTTTGFNIDGLLQLKVSLAAILMTLALLRYFYIQDLWHMEVEKFSNAKLLALQARIKPHFLFNSLNSIAALIPDNPEKAENAVVSFSDLMRRTFVGEQKVISLKEELEFVEQYISIEKLRLGDRLNFSISGKPDCLDLTIPVLCLQPLVENAIVHGIQNLPEGGEVNLSYELIDKKLQIKVTNPYVETEKISNETALINIEQRLEILFGPKKHIEIEKEGGLFKVKMEIPQ